MFEDIMDMEFFADGTAWGIGIVVWMIFMYIMWGLGLLVSQHTSWVGKTMLSILGLPTCYIVAKIMIDRGR